MATIEIQGLSKSQALSAFEADPVLCKEVLPMDSGGILKIIALVFVFWLFMFFSGAYSYSVSREFGPIIFVLALGMIVFLFLFWLYKQRSTLEGRIAASNLGAKVGLETEGGELKSFEYDFGFKWTRDRGLLSHSHLYNIYFKDYSNGLSVLFYTYKGGEFPSLLIDADGKNKIVEILKGCRNIAYSSDGAVPEFRF